MANFCLTFKSSQLHQTLPTARGAMISIKIYEDKSDSKVVEQANNETRICTHTITSTRIAQIFQIYILQDS